MKRVDLVVIGNLLLDDLPHGVNVPGGAALFTALAARCCGLTVGVHSVVGEDYPLQWLEEAGVHLSLHHLPGPGGRTVIRYTPEGRTLEHQGPGHHQLSPQTPHPFQTKLVHIAPMPTDLQAFHLSHCAAQTATIDPYPVLNSQTWALLEPYKDRLLALLLNQEELELDPKSLCPTTWTVLKLADKGGLSYRPACQWSAVATEVVDLTGAGDSFAAGLAAGWLQGLGHQGSLDLAAQVASWALPEVGAEGLYRRARGA